MVTSMYLAYIRGCYAVATSLVMGWVGWGGMVTCMYIIYICICIYMYIFDIKSCITRGFHR